MYEIFSGWSVPLNFGGVSALQCCTGNFLTYFKAPNFQHQI